MTTHQKVEAQGYYTPYYPIIGTDMFIKPLSTGAVSQISLSDRLLQHKFNQAVRDGSVLSTDSGIQTEDIAQSTHRGFTIYLIPEDCNLPIEKAVKQKIATLVSPWPFSFGNQHSDSEQSIVPQIDEAGNLVLKAANFPLENIGDGGNAFITRNGNLTQFYDDHGIIHPYDSESQLYPVTIYTKKKTPNKLIEIVSTKFNFLDAEGKQVFVGHFERSEHPTLIEIPAKSSQVAYTPSGSKKKASIYSPRYAFDVGTAQALCYDNSGDKQKLYTPELFPTIADLLISNRKLPTPLLKDDSHLVAKLYKRYNDLPEIFRLVKEQKSTNKITQEEYNNIIEELQEEREKMLYFISTLDNTKNSSNLDKDDNVM